MLSKISPGAERHGMEHLFYSLMTLVMQWYKPRYNARLQIQAAQIRMLRTRIKANRIVPTPAEKSELLRLGRELDDDIVDVMYIVQPRTYRKWLRQTVQGIVFKPSGRPRTPKATIDLVLRMAQENIRWGYRKIVGELKKLGISIGTTTVRQILKDSDIHPDPGKAFKKPDVPWTTFVHAHIDSMVSTDFFTKRVYTLRGVFTAYTLMFIHLGTRKVFCSPATLNPNEEWVMQQTRNANMWLQDLGVKPRFLVHDRDTKYPKAFREFWKSEDVRCIRIPLRAPKANAFSETWIESYKRECLNQFICFDLAQLDYITKTWLRYYNFRRPHRGIGMNNEVLDERFEPQLRGTVRCEEQLGGLIKTYYREAA